jgi:hypothetical protein
VSNLRRHKFQHPEIRNGCTNAWELRRLPSGFVLVDVSVFAVPHFAKDLPRTPLPLELDQLKDGYVPASQRCECSFRGAVIVAERVYTVRVWIADDASATLREAVEELVRSIRFNVRRS